MLPTRYPVFRISTITAQQRSICEYQIHNVLPHSCLQLQEATEICPRWHCTLLRHSTGLNLDIHCEFIRFL